MSVTYSADGVTATFTGNGELTNAVVDYYLGSATVAIIVDYSSIAAYAFFGATSLTSITIPASVESIGNNAFYLASALNTVTFKTGSQLTSIGERAFQSASSLTSITIPA
ncbi:leucine-rich repeat domain-containing protein, partial [bacterium]|nr:leucine-rich repeat domain-containing protein [bacterium]